MCRLSLAAACPNITLEQASQGAGTTCGPGRCLGACCNGPCSLTHRLRCGGAFQGYTTSCTPDLCAGLGACCLFFGPCAITQITNCGGDFIGGACSPCTCADNEPVGACCQATGCAILGPSCCAGEFLGAGTTCTASCDGACCAGSTCTLTTQPACDNGRTFHGRGTTCGPTPDNPTLCCPANFNGTGGLSVQDIFDFLAAYFAGLFTADFNHSMSITVQDIFDFLAAYFAGCSG
jgi:hypothetical protein